MADFNPGILSVLLPLLSGELPGYDTGIDIGRGRNKFLPTSGYPIPGEKPNIENVISPLSGDYAGPQGARTPHGGLNPPSGYGGGMNAPTPHAIQGIAPQPAPQFPERAMGAQGLPDTSRGLAMFPQNNPYVMGGGKPEVRAESPSEAAINFGGRSKGRGKQPIPSIALKMPEVANALGVSEDTFHDEIMKKADKFMPTKKDKKGIFDFTNDELSFLMVSAGLAIAAGESEFPLQNIAAGGLHGLTALQDMRAAETEREDKRFEQRQDAISTALDISKEEREASERQSAAGKMEADAQSYETEGNPEAAARIRDVAEALGNPTASEERIIAEIQKENPDMSTLEALYAYKIATSKADTTMNSILLKEVMQSFLNPFGDRSLPKGDDETIEEYTARAVKAAKDIISGYGGPAGGIDIEGAEAPTPTKNISDLLPGQQKLIQDAMAQGHDVNSLRKRLEEKGKDPVWLNGVTF